MKKIALESAEIKQKGGAFSRTFPLKTHYLRRKILFSETLPEETRALAR